MNFLYFLIGIVVGIGLSTVFFVASLFDKNADSIDNVTSTIRRVTKGLMQEKGAILYPKSDEQDAMEQFFAANDKKGIDTPVGEIEGHE